MTFLPVVERELRTAARQRAAHRMRLAAALLALVIWFIFSISGNITSTQRAQFIFGTIGTLSLGFAMLAGAFLTADCLSEERREGTLGLLFLTDLKGHDVVLGKLASTSLNSFYGFLAVVPMLAVPLLMGGVTGGEFARTALVLLTTLFLSLSTGMFVSAISHDSRVAFIRTLATMVILSGVLPLFWWGLRVLLQLRPFDFLLWPSPGYALRYAGDSFYSTRSGAGEFWTSLLVMSGIGIVFLAAASVLLPRIWQQARDEGAGRTASDPSVLKRRNRLKAELESRPYFWLATRDQRMARWANWAIGGSLLVWFTFYVHAGAVGPGRASFAILLLLAFGVHVLFKCIVAAEVTRRLSEDRASGALELLLITPLGPKQIIAGQKAAEAWLFRWPKWMLTVMNLLFIGQILWPRGGLAGAERMIFVLIFSGGILLLFADCFVIGSAAVWSALTTKRHARAILKTIRIVLLPAWIGIIGFWFLGVTSRGLTSDTVTMLVVTWITLALIVDGVVLSIMRRRLNSDFRERVATGATRGFKFSPEASG